MQHDKGYEAAKNSGNSAVYFVADYILLKKMKELDPDLLDAEGKIYREAAIELFKRQMWVTGIVPIHNQILTSACSLFHTSEANASPLILDLDGDGVETTRLGEMSKPPKTGCADSYVINQQRRKELR